MPKSVPIALSTHKARAVITTSRLLKIILASGTILRMTSLDRDEVYDDGSGEETWHSATGLQMATMESTNDLSVDNSEARSLVPIFPLPGITEDMVNRGELNDAIYWVFEHDYENGAAGIHEIMANGPLGACRMEHGLVAIPELRSWTQLLDQTGIISQTCLDCRTKRFGSQEGDEREWCGYDISSEWVSFTVTAVGDESVREFYTDDLPQVDDYFAPGLVHWTGGDNTGTSVEVESFFGNSTSSDAYSSLRFTVRKPIQIGDTGEIRRDCTRKWSGHNSCETFFGSARGAHFNGEPFINIGDSKANTIPGVNTTTNTGGSGESTPTVPASTDGVSTATRTRGATVVTVSSSLGNGSTDVTANIQAAINSLPSDGGTVTIPPGASGAYRIDPVVGLLLRSNMLLEIQTGAELHALYTATDHVAIVKIHGVHDVEVSGGGTLRGFRDAWSPIVGTTSEWGHCINCFGSTRVTISNLIAMKAVGDGMSVGHFGSVGCSDIFVDNVRFHDNRRQGLSLVYVDGCVVQDSEFDHISGTAPESGIDIEPNGGVCRNITISNCHIHDNHAYGINILQLADHGTVESITVQDCTVELQGKVGIVSNGVKNIEIKNNTMRLNSAQGLSIIDTTNIDVTGNTFTSNFTRNTTWANTPRTASDITGVSSATTHDIIMTGSNSGVIIGLNHYT